jgi:hypothetical protein
VTNTVYQGLPQLRGILDAQKAIELHRLQRNALTGPPMPMADALAAANANMQR